MDVEDLNEVQLDALKEIVNIGAGNAATALSQLTKKKVSMSIPRARVCKIQDVPRVLGMGGEDEPISIVYNQIVGDTSGAIMMIFDAKESLKLVDVLLGKEIGESMFLDEMGQSAIKEIGNICSGASLASISEFTGMKYLYSIPLFASDMLGAILNAILSKFAASASSTLVVMAELKVEELVVKSTILFIFTSEDVKLILEKLRVI